MGFRIHPAWWFFGISGLVLISISIMLFGPELSNRKPTGQPLAVQCQEGLRSPVEEISREYERETGQRVDVQYGGSQMILSCIKTTRIGDLFLPADESYMEDARKDGLIAEVIPVARMTAVLAVAQGNPRKIQSWNDLLDAKNKVALAEPDVAAIGRLTRDHLSKSGKWDALQKVTTVKKTNVNLVANAVALGGVDAGIVWDSVARVQPKLAMISLPGLDEITARVQIGILTTSKQPTSAIQFARFLTAKDRGLKRFRDHGFVQVESGDKGTLKPELIFFAGSMLRPAVEKTIAEFEAREGVTVQRVYNGCGILVSQMRTGERPDIFFACDTRFMEAAREWLEPATVISSNQLVIAVKKGNPHGIATLKDLGKPGLKVGVGHEQQCALGTISREAFIQSGTYTAVVKNVAVQSPTGDLLVNQLRVGALDAAVVYRSNALPYPDLDFVPVTGMTCATPEQPIAISKSTEYPHLTSRLIDAIRSADSQHRFEESGFHWGKN